MYVNLRECLGDSQQNIRKIWLLEILLSNESRFSIYATYS